MFVFTAKRREFIAKYLSDISKLFFAASVVKQYVGQTWSIPTLLVGACLSLVIVGFAFVVHLKE